MNTKRDPNNYSEVITFRAKGDLLKFLKSNKTGKSRNAFIIEVLLNSTEYMEFVLQQRKALDDKTPSLFLF